MNSPKRRQPFEIFVIVSEPRTGSNMLTSILSSLDSAVCHAEVFHPDRIYIKLPKEIVPGKEERDSDPEHFLEKIIKKTYEYHGRPKHIGFKLFFEHNKRIHKLIAKEKIPVILLERKNKLAQYSSIKIAKKTNQWTSVQQKRDKGQSLDRTVRFSVIEYVLYTLRSRIQFRCYLNRLLKNDIPFLHTFYEDIVQGNGLSLIQHFLGITGKLTIDRSGYKKQNPNNLYERFSNKAYAKVSTKILGYLGL